MPRSRTRRSRRLRGQDLAIAATVLGTVLLLIGGYLALTDDSAEPRSLSVPQPTLLPDQAVGGGGLESLEALLDPQNLPDGTRPSDEGEGLKRIDNQARYYDVTVTLRSEGPMRYVVRTKSGDGPVVRANGTVTIKKRLRGPRYVIQVFVQTLDRSSSCSISLDGRTVSSSREARQYHVTLCSG